MQEPRHLPQHGKEQIQVCFGLTLVGPFLALFGSFLVLFVHYPLGPFGDQPPPLPVALGDTFLKFIQTLNRAQKQFNSIFIQNLNLKYSFNKIFIQYIVTNIQFNIQFKKIKKNDSKSCDFQTLSESL